MEDSPLREAKGLVDRTGRTISFTDLLQGEEGAAPPEAILLYFSASWCGPCKAFTPKLIASYEAMKAANKPVQCIFISGCRTARDFDSYLQRMPFLAVPFSENELRQRIMQFYKVSAFPSMVVMDPISGRWFNLDGRKAVAEDPKGDQLPWTKYKLPVFCLDKLKHTDPMPGPVWCERVFISMFLEGCLESTETRGDDNKRCGDIAALMHVHHFVTEKIIENRPEWISLCNEEDRKALIEVNELFKKGMELSRACMKIKQPFHFTSFLQKFATELNDLKSGQEMVVPGGWQDTDSGHCIMHVLKRQEKEGFSLSIHNLGKGIKFHRSTASQPPGMKFEASVVFHNIPQERVLDHGFWYMFFKIHVTKSDDHRHEIFYDVLYPHLLGMPFARACALEAKNATKEPGTGFFPAQRAETCYYSSVNRCFEFLLAQHGLHEEAKIIQFRFAFMRAMVNMVHSDMQQVNSQINHSDARLVRIAAQKLSNAASSESKAGRLKGANLAEILAKIEQIEEMTIRRANGIDVRMIPKLKPKSEDKWGPLRGFQVYKRDKSVEAFAGWQDAVPHNHLIDMAKLPTIFAKDSKSALEAIDMCLNLCKLLSRKHTSNSYFYICSLIQQLFVQVLPMPIPPAERKELKDCIWASMEMKREQYLQIIDSLQQLARYYTAAARSVQSNREFRGANIVVMACIMACLDAIVRTYSTDKPSTVAMVLNGTQHLFSGSKQRARGPTALKIVKSEEEFNAEIKAANDADKLVVIDFFSAKSKECKEMTPIYATLGRKFNKKPVVMLKLDSEKLSALARRYHVRSFPTFKFLYLDMELDTLTEADPRQLEQKLTTFVQRLEKGELEEKTRPLIEADSEKAMQLMAFGYEKLAVDWALRNCNNNMQAAAEKLMDTTPDNLMTAIMIETSARQMIIEENKKIQERNAERKKKREEKENTLTPTGKDEQKGGGGAAGSSADATAHSSSSSPAAAAATTTTSSSSNSEEKDGEQKSSSSSSSSPPLFNREAAMKLLQPDFYVCMYDGYGTHIDEITDTALILEPTLAVARGKMLRYFLAQEKHGKKALFNFKTRHNCTTFLSKNSPTMEMVKVLCNVMGYDLQPKDEENKTMDDGISFIEAATWYLTHHKSPFAEEHPELLALRDTALLYRILVTDTAHRRHVKLQRWTISHAAIGWKIKEPGGINSAKTQVDLNASCFNQEFVCIETKPKKSPADPKLWVKKGAAESLEKITEDDVLHQRQLPTFNNALSQEDSEYLLSALTAPYMRIPIVVSFFSTKDRVSALLNLQLQELLESVLFEPMRWTPEDAPDIRYVPAKGDELIGCPNGLLLNELEHAPDVLVSSMLQLTEDALYLNTGSYTSSSTSIILFVIRMLSGVHRFISFLLNDHNDDAKKTKLEASKKEKLEGYSKKIHEILIDKARPILVQWEQQAQDQSDLRHSCIMNAHLTILYRGVHYSENISLANVQPMMAYLAFLQTWHSPGLGQGAMEEEKKRRIREAKAADGDVRKRSSKQQSSREQAQAERLKIEKPLLVAEHVYFDMLNIHRQGLVKWFKKASAKEVDAVMQSILRVATRNQRLQSSGWVARSGDGNTGVFCGKKEEIEINIQSIELYFRNSHIEPVPNHMARTDDFALIFGKEPQHCALVAAHEHRQWVRLVGRSYNIRRWDEPKDEKRTMINMPHPIAEGERGFRWQGIEYSRPFPSDKIRPEERWILKVVEPTILSKFGQWKKVPYVKEKRFFMSKEPVGENAYSTSLIAFDKGTWRIFKVVKHLNVCFMYVLLEHGRRMYPSLVYTSNTRYCYYSMKPDTDDRGSPFHPLLRNEAGKITGKVALKDSVVISRDVKDDIEETFTPERFLRGVIPAALTENFFFWQRDTDDHLVGYPKELHHPDFQYKIRVRLIDFKNNDNKEKEEEEEGVGPAGSSSSSLCGVITRSPLLKSDVKANTEIAAKNFFDVKMQLADDDPMVVAIKSSKLEVVVSQGYPRHIAKQVLEQFKYDLPIAQSWLANPKNQEKISAMKGELANLDKSGGGGGDGDAKDAAMMALEEDDIVPKLIRSKSQKDHHMMVLFDLLSVPKESVLGRMVNVLSRIEDLGHILAWTESTVTEYGSLCQISLIELPRLKLRFSPRRDNDGKERLYSLDHSDLYISDLRDERLNKLSTGIPHSLLMENASRELFLMVSNCPVHRPYISRCPLSTELKMDHRDPEWLESMASRVYLYPIHGSHTFLVTPTLSSAMYLILLRMMSRQYQMAFRVVQSCEADRKLAQDEAWVFRQLRMANRDKHPNAHAVRLKFSLVVMFSGMNIEELWELQSEFKEYILKLDQVSADCKLSLDEETLLLDHIRNSNEFAQYDKVENQLDIQRGALDAELSNRHNYILMLLAGRGEDGTTSTTTRNKKKKDEKEAKNKSGVINDDDLFTHGQNDMQYGEATTWDKVERQIDLFFQDYSPNHRTWRAQCEYYRPQMGRLRQSSAIETLNEMWKDQVTGVVRQLGFYFVLELLLNRVEIYLVDPRQNNSKSLGKLFARILLLKNMQWGGRANLELKSSYNDNSWYPYVILGLLHHWTSSPSSLPQLPSYLAHQLSEGQQTYSFAGPTEFGRHLSQFIERLRPVVSSSSRIKALHYPPLNPAIISRIPVPPYSSVKPLPQVTDFSCASRRLEPFLLLNEREKEEKEKEEEEGGEEKEGMKIELSSQDCEWMRTSPLGPIGLDTFVKVEERSKNLPGRMPFDLTKHDAADSHVAREMLKRLEKDIKLHAEMENAKKVPGLIGLMDDDFDIISSENPDASALNALCSKGSTFLQNLITNLLELRQQDTNQIHLLTKYLITIANNVELDQNRSDLLPKLRDPLQHDDNEDDDNEQGDEKKRNTPKNSTKTSNNSDESWSELIQAVAPPPPPPPPAAAAAASSHQNDDEKEEENEEEAAGGRREDTAMITMEQRHGFNQQENRYLFLLQRKAQTETNIWLEYLCATTLSANPGVELLRLNPFLTEKNIKLILRMTIGFMLRVNRQGCIDRCLSRALSLQQLLQAHSKGLDAMDIESRKELQKLLGHKATELAKLLTSRRFCMGTGMPAEKTHKLEFDPRYLIFEYLYNILLRSKQVALINTFLAANKENRSLVRQMIMGAGKSTVVGPMLSLILADGKSLVTLVVPSSLLEMSRNVMRARFTRVIPKRVHTFSFDRSCVWVGEITKMYSKLKDARTTKGVVVTTSEAIKSLMLKHIELLDAMRCAPPRLTKVGEKRLRIKSVMADEIARIMRLWSNNGVLILDEVDLLLHPLRSELNFPIGPKKTLDLSPLRWELPVHLLDAIFFSITGRVSVKIGMEGAGGSLSSSSSSSGSSSIVGGDVGRTISGLSSHGQQILLRINDVLREGIAGQFLQTSPHIVLLDTAWYHKKLKPALALWVLLWLRSKQLIQLTLNDDHAIAYLTKGPKGEQEFLEKSPSSSSLSPIEATHETTQKKMLNLAADWLQSYAPHVLTKIDRVSYGLLLKEDMERVDQNTPASRKLMAVPFVGKDVPSHSSEFAQPDVLIGLSILAYRYEGLRISDIVEVVKQLQNSLREEVGPLAERPSARRFKRWLEVGNARLRQDWVKKQKMRLRRRQQEESQHNLTLKRTLSKEDKHKHRMENTQQSQMVSEADAPVYNVNPLHIFQLSDLFQLNNLFKCVASLPELVHYYLDQMVFPATLQHQETKISASGQELGGELLFPRRLGFSGTPSDLLPLELGACGYEQGSEGSIIHTLVNPSVVSYQLIHPDEEHSNDDDNDDDDSHEEEGKKSKNEDPRSNNKNSLSPSNDDYDEKSSSSAAASSSLSTTAKSKEEEEKKKKKHHRNQNSWTVHGLLTKIASAQPPYNALIDTGALVTGMTNEEVARFLMQNGLSKTMDACVFLDREDRQMALLKSGKSIPLKQCGVKLAKRFSFYDQVHTTGMDIKQAMNATAVVTLGKDMTHRDFSQGCYRMRGIGQGQTIHLYIIPEVRKLVRKEVGDSGSLQRDVNAWLLVNSMRSEKLQFMQLCIQNTANVFRKKCHKKLLKATDVGGEKQQGALSRQRRCWRFQEDFGEEMEGVRKAIMLFREKVDFSVRSKAVLEQKSFVGMLDSMVSEHKHVLYDDNNNNNTLSKQKKEGGGGRSSSINEAKKALETLDHIQMLASNAGNPLELSRQKSLNQEMVQEAEQEAQKQKEKQVEQEQQVQLRFSREDESHVPWAVLKLTENPQDILYLEDEEGKDHRKFVMAQTVHERHAFYKFKQFSLRGVGKSDLAVPDNMLLSHNYFRPEWASTGQRRLKNIVAVLEWQRPQSTTTTTTTTSSSSSSTENVKNDVKKDIEDDKHKVATSPSPSSSSSSSSSSSPHEKQLARMFQLLDFENKNYMNANNVTTLLRILGEKFSPKELEDMMMMMGKDGDEDDHENDDPKMRKRGGKKIGFEEFKQMVLQWSSGSFSKNSSSSSSLVTDKEKGKSPSQPMSRRFVCISLSEAESIRRLIHSNHPLLQVSNKHQVGVGLRLLQGGGMLIDQSPRYVPDNHSANADLQSAMGCFRFINCDFFYDDTELLMLMRGLQSTKKVVRRAFFENALRCRRRDRQRYNDTPLAKVFSLTDHFHVLVNRAALFRIRNAILRKGLLIRDAFDVFDTVGDGRLYETELWFALNDGFLELGFTDDEIGHLVTHCDKDNDGQISKYEFLEALCLEEDYKNDEERFLRGDFKQYPPLKLPDHLKKRYVEEGERRKKRLAAERAAIEAMESRIAEEKKAFHFRPIFEALDRGQKGYVSLEDILVFLPSFNPTDFKAMGKAVSKPDAKRLDFKDFCVAGTGVAKQLLKKFSEKKTKGSTSSKGEWNCPACTFLNPASNKACGVCGADKPPKIAREATVDDEDSVDLLNNFEPPVWVCPACTTRNEKQYLKCNVCGTDKPPRKKRALIDALWECMSCTYQNTRYANVCGVCNTPRPRSQ